MKRVGHLMEQIASLDNLYLAFQKASRGKHDKKEILLFEQHFDTEIAQLHTELLDGTIAIGQYRYFTIYDPKERIISAAPFRDRVLQHAIINVCMPYFDRTLIETTYATRKGKGVYAALNKAVTAASAYGYLAKLDVRKYYDSINHTILKARLRRMFKDRALLALFDKIIDSYSTTTGCGLPIGNLTSQYFANLYLSDLDHHAKEQWHASVYIRYMDDILIASDDKQSLKTCVNNMVDYAKQTLLLTFKPPIIHKAKDGQVFLGYTIYPHYKLLAGRSKRRFRSKIITYSQLLNEGVWTQAQYQEHILPLLSFVMHAACKTFRQECMMLTKGNSRRVGLTA